MTFTCPRHLISVMKLFHASIPASQDIVQNYKKERGNATRDTNSKDTYRYLTERLSYATDSELMCYENAQLFYMYESVQ